MVALVNTVMAMAVARVGALLRTPTSAETPRRCDQARDLLS
jgi:hypothetical protein